MDPVELKKIIDAHGRWLRGESDGVRANLDGANLDGANLVGANLVGANLVGANLVRANLDGANLDGANLVRANLVGANLVGANLDGANLDGANLDGANLVRANLDGANLDGANLDGANLVGANLRGANNLPEWIWNLAARDILYVFSHCAAEVPALRENLIAGKVNGSQYEGQCACLIGSLSNAAPNGGYKHYCESRIPRYDLGLHNPSEQWFYQIREGDTPENSEFAKKAVALCDEFLARSVTKLAGGA